jgi:hypothetical protein
MKLFTVKTYNRYSQYEHEDPLKHIGLSRDYFILHTGIKHYLKFLFYLTSEVLDKIFPIFPFI